MRISTSQITSAGIREMLLRQAEIQHTQLQLSTQLRVLKPSDDPVAATAISALTSEIAQLEQFNRNSDAAKASNELEETILGSSTDILFRMRELTVALGNGSYTQNEYNSIGVELEEGLKELLGLANSRNANGDYIFSGGQVDSKSFIKDAAGNISYNGDQNQRLLRISSGVVTQVSDSGFDVFVDIKNGNGAFTINSNTANTGGAIITQGSYQAPPNFLAEPYSITFATDASNNTTYTVTGDVSGTTFVPATIYEPGNAISFNGVTVEVSGEPDAGDIVGVAPSQSQSVFSVVQDAINAIGQFDDTEAGRAEFSNRMTNVQESLNNSLDNINIVRGRLGGRLNAIDSEFDSNLNQIATNKSSLSDVRDLDVIEASTRYSQQLVVLEAAQASFVRIQGLSLFNFL
ncbi:MAG: flagellar hook-associated protein FlgL [Kangiellaceae bacterium]|nr:flagellar hook-associated protein FlgL [Kangiellaceae bacterium]